MTNGPLHLRDIRSFHIGGARVCLADQPQHLVRVSPDATPRQVDMNGHYVAGQLYAQHFMLEAPRHDLPVLFWHGGAMTGVTWETTPDNRPGWSADFLRAGYDVVVSDAVERGRASWAPYPQIFSSDPLFRTEEDAWTMFRMGKAEGYDPDPARRTPYQPQRFPIESFGQLCAQFVPRWTTNADLTVDAYGHLVDRLGRVIIVAHSQGGWFAQRVAARRPDAIAAIVVVEPAGAPNLSEDDYARAAQVPHLFIWGDNCDEHPAWGRYKPDAVAASDRLRRHGGRVEHLDLPTLGIFGNSHLPMMDDNSFEIGQMVRRWLEGLERAADRVEFGAMACPPIA